MQNEYLDITKFLIFPETMDPQRVSLFKKNKPTLNWLTKIHRNYFVPQPFEISAINANLNTGVVYSAQIWVRDAQARLTDDHGVFVTVNKQPKLSPHKETRLIEYRRDSAVVAIELVSRKKTKAFESRWVMVEQYRMGGLHAGKTLEVPGGMVEDGNVQISALREVEEETNVRLEPKHLIPLGTHAASSAWSNETGAFYYARAYATPAAIRALEGLKAGNEAQEENTVLRLIPENDMPTALRDCLTNSTAFFTARYVRGLTKADFSDFVIRQSLCDNERSVIVPYAPSASVIKAVSRKLGIG